MEVIAGVGVAVGSTALILGAWADSPAVAAPHFSPTTAEIIDLTDGKAGIEQVADALSISAEPAPAPVAEASGPPAPPAPPVPASVSPTPSGWFTPVAHYGLTARFGVPGSWASGYHTGLDFATKYGSPVRAATSGVVVASIFESAYGNLVQIKVGPSTQVWYAHLGDVYVEEGQRVKAGDVIGRVGMTGRTSGPHSHFEVRIKDKPQNPEDYLWSDGHPVTRMR